MKPQTFITKIIELCFFIRFVFSKIIKYCLDRFGTSYVIWCTQRTALCYPTSTSNLIKASFGPFTSCKVHVWCWPCIQLQQIYLFRQIPTIISKCWHAWMLIDCYKWIFFSSSGQITHLSRQGIALLLINLGLSVDLSAWKESFRLSPDCSLKFTCLQCYYDCRKTSPFSNI